MYCLASYALSHQRSGKALSCGFVGKRGEGQVKQYVRRRFPMGQYDHLSCWVRLLQVDTLLFVIFKDDLKESPPGALAAHFEYAANFFTIELVARGYGQFITRFFHERPVPGSRAVRQIQEVQLTKQSGQYHLAFWVETDARTLSLLNEPSRLGGPGQILP